MITCLSAADTLKKGDFFINIHIKQIPVVR
jgi:hypothetical protein